MNDFFLGRSLWIYFIDGSPVDFPTQSIATSESKTALWFQSMVQFSQFSAIGMVFLDPPMMRSYFLDGVMELKKKSSDLIRKNWGSNNNFLRLPAFEQCRKPPGWLMIGDDTTPNFFLGLSIREVTFEKPTSTRPGKRLQKTNWKDPPCY